ncbi:HPF/RaiA family ribosome-associated protein [Microvirga alba]|uniref:HPF/RaiA family ribosome-associated protein n=1 Tax=Microvirga alba TaxID=2791025 RepID=A0A931BVB8_9HYPH|nr:HPF/RaiA family ribosome-associated protein [Microvirga alba]MBF9235383.1 HPF/RaiA family ribosome-associated protein [Microvirga alba]
MKPNGAGTPIKVNGSGIDLGETLPHEVQAKLMHVVGRYFDCLNHGTVGFTREGHSCGCTINVHVGNLKMIIAEGSATNCHLAFGQALANVEKQLHRRRRRMADGSRIQPPSRALA